MIAEIRRNSNYPAAEWRALPASEPIDAADMLRRLRKALEEAETFVSRMPTDKMGLLFIQDGLVLQPEPDALATYQVHAGRRQGHWPSNPEITAAMLERFYRQPGGRERQ